VSATGNTYVGLGDLQGVIDEAASQALAQQIRRAIQHLTTGQGSQFEEVVALLREMIGEDS
jgi:hypothetical protein